MAEEPMGQPAGRPAGQQFGGRPIGVWIVAAAIVVLIIVVLAVWLTGNNNDVLPTPTLPAGVATP